jgi:hypothetical protein
MMGEESFHPDTRALLAYGRALAGASAGPRKGGADQVLERLFVIERMPDGRWPIRSFGTELIELFGVDLKERDFAALWLAPDIKLLNALMGRRSSTDARSCACVWAHCIPRSRKRRTACASW